MSHGCIANTSQVFSRRPPYTSTCMATVDITRGQEIFTTYLKRTQPTDLRRKKLKDGWYFECICERCADPTESGSYVGAVACPKCNADTIENNSRYR